MKTTLKLTRILLIPILAVPAAGFAQSSAAPRVATVRGMLEDNTGKKPAPASGFLVTVESKNYTSPAVRSGKDGLYYIPNVAPGNYTLKVWTDPKTPLSFPITVKGQLTDIPPVIVASANAKPKAAGGKSKPGTAAPK